MMQSYSKNEAIDRINKLAKTGEAFLFIINYKQDCSFVEQIDNIDPSELLYNLNGFPNMRRCFCSPAGNIPPKASAAN